LQYWCNDHDNEFPNVAFLAQQILDIPRSRIETKRIFNVDIILTSLQQCWLGVLNLDKLGMILKDWLNNVKIGCTLAFKWME
jgi:hypothetical protein